MAVDTQSFEVMLRDRPTDETVFIGEHLVGMEEHDIRACACHGGLVHVNDPLRTRLRHDVLDRTDSRRHPRPGPEQEV